MLKTAEENFQVFVVCLCWSLIDVGLLCASYCYVFCWKFWFCARWFWLLLRKSFINSSMFTFVSWYLFLHLYLHFICYFTSSWFNCFANKSICVAILQNCFLAREENAGSQCSLLRRSGPITKRRECTYNKERPKLVVGAIRIYFGRVPRDRSFAIVLGYT